MAQPVGRLRHRGSAPGVRQGSDTEHRQAIKPDPTVDRLPGPESTEMEVQAIPRRQGPEMGQVIGTGTTERLATAEVESLLEKPKDREAMVKTKVPIEGTAMDIDHQIGP